MTHNNNNNNNIIIIIIIAVSIFIIENNTEKNAGQLFCIQKILLRSRTFHIFRHELKFLNYMGNWLEHWLNIQQILQIK